MVHFCSSCGKFYPDKCPTHGPDAISDPLDEGLEPQPDVLAQRTGEREAAALSEPSEQAAFAKWWLSLDGFDCPE